MNDWMNDLRHNPYPLLLDNHLPAMVHFVRQELLGENVEKVQIFWKLPEVLKIINKLQADGSWKWRGKRSPLSVVKYDLIETWKQLRFLVEMYGVTREHPAVSKAAEYIFSCQTDEGDIRGILGNQFTPYYCGALASLLNQAGYQDDPRTDALLQWLLTMRQDDGGWVIGAPGIMNGEFSWEEVGQLTSQDMPTVRDFDRGKPSSHAGTGMVIRGFATHAEWRHSAEAAAAAKFLKGQFFKRDNYSSYQHPDHWVRFQFPFWWNNLVAALESVIMIGFDLNDPDVKKAVDWLIDHQQEDGLWKASYSSIHKESTSSKAREQALWISYKICCIFKRLYSKV